MFEQQQQLDTLTTDEMYSGQLFPNFRCFFEPFPYKTVVILKSIMLSIRAGGAVAEQGTILLHALCNMKDITMTVAGSERVLFPATKVLKSTMMSRDAVVAAECSRAGYKYVTRPM